MSNSNSLTTRSVLVACLCAQWCGVCTQYRSTFEQVRQQVQALHPQVQFLWIDVEDEADLLHPLDVEDFPTLLLAVNLQPHFFGPITPQAQTLERLIRMVMADTSAALMTRPELVSVINRIQATKSDKVRLGVLT